MNLPELQVSEGKFKVRDGHQLFYRYYLNPAATETMILLHGHGEHSGRYRKFAEYLRDKKLSLAMYDMRGCGQSDGEHCYVNQYEEYLHDLTDFTLFLEHKYVLNRPFHLFGHSNGGLTALHWALENPKEVKALYLSSPYIGLKLPSALLMINRFLNAFFPHFVYQNPVYPPYLTHNPAEVDHYKRDLLIRRKITPKLLSEMIRFHNKTEAFKRVEVSFPVFVLMSGLDRIVDPAKTHLFFDKVKAPHKELRVFEGFYHEIFNELGQEKVFEALREQIDKSRI